MEVLMLLPILAVLVVLKLLLLPFDPRRQRRGPYPHPYDGRDHRDDELLDDLLGAWLSGRGRKREGR